ncbi:hypothetical protein OAR36_06830 [Pseudomonadales bacterium]|nr:hypothetical protein [Pseudomonadales bacterium]
MADQIEEASTYNDEIDLKALLMAILDTRVWVVAALLVASAAFWVLVVLQNKQKPEIHRYESRIDLVFAGVSAEEYPNGSPFSLSDVIAPVVLNEIYEKNELETFMGRQAFVSSFTVEPYTPGRNFIRTKYEGLLANKKLGPTEIEELQARYNVELRNNALGSATIIFSSRGDSGVPLALIKSILREIPAEWSRRMIEDQGVVRADRRMYTSKVVDANMVEGLDYLIMYEVLLERLRLLDANIATLRGMPNGLVVIDEVSEFTLLDLEQGVLDVRQYQIGPVMNPIGRLGVAKDTRTVELYFNNSLETLARTTSVLEAKQRNFEKAYDDYSQVSAIESAGRSGGTSTGSMIPQFGAEFLDKIVDLTKSGSDLEYRQDLNQRGLAIANELAETAGERMRIMALITAVQGTDDTPETIALKKEYEARLLREMPGLFAQLEGYFDISTRLYLKLSGEQLGSTGELYRYTDGQVDVSVSGNILNTTNIKFFVIVCFLVMVLVVPLTMVRNALRK